MLCYKHGISTFKESGVSPELPLGLVPQEKASGVDWYGGRKIAGDIGTGGDGEAGEDTGIGSQARPFTPVCVLLSTDGGTQIGKDVQGQEFQHSAKGIHIFAQATFPLDEQLLCIYGRQCVERDNPQVYRGTEHDMKKTYKYRLLANASTFGNAEGWLNLCRNLYNAALEQRITAYKQNKGHISCYDQINELPELKAAMPEYRDVGSQVLQEVVERLDKAYAGFFRRIKNGNGKAGFPRFKGRNRYDSFTLKQSGWKLEGRYLSVRNVGRFKLRLSRPIEGSIKTVAIRRSPTGKWYVCFSCDNVPERKLDKSTRAVGIDVGIKAFCVDSEGNSTDNPQYLRQSLKLLRRRQRILCRRRKGSNGRRKARVLVARAHEKVKNQRSDFLHKLANQYVADYGLIYVEDLNIKGMVRNKHLSKSISDSSWGEFFRLLEYKAAEAGRMVAQVPPNNTSQICSGCGEKVPKSMAVRIHCCPHCGLVMDRDKNAARNILAVGQTAQEVTYAVA